MVKGGMGRGTVRCECWVGVGGLGLGLCGAGQCGERCGAGVGWEWVMGVMCGLWVGLGGWDCGDDQQHT